MLMRAVTFLIAFGCALLINGPVQVAFARGDDVSNSATLKAAEFNQRFRNHPDLKKTDFEIFPHGLRSYLNVHSRLDRVGTTAFSRQIEWRTFLIVVTDDVGAANVSKAVLVTQRGRAVSPNEGLSWQPLQLPAFNKVSDGWSIIVTDRFFNLEWNEDLRAVQSTYCSDAGPVSCLRHTTKISPNRQELIMAEYYTSHLGEWTPFWIEGVWLFNPENE